MAKDNQKQAIATETLARDARRDSEIMKRDSATMKTITVVTLVYLPATFVSTLLSMGIFEFGVSNSEDGRIRIAREGWVFLAISLPLTALTLGLAFLWKQYKERGWKQEAEDAKKGADEAAGRAESAPDGTAPERISPESGWLRLLARLQRLRRRPARPVDLEMGEANT
ncbi:hypothetical protein AURDEDRAFT_169469 [Auricularia subglabra TFB-10046 SS5]|nr:hypothetical protein AURDEDRAFT_169469 [Auricularia subglabra TFB-10046 SS5]